MVRIYREWAMPNKNTFSIAPIRSFIGLHLTQGKWLDPFSRNSPFAGNMTTNDLDPSFPADSHMEAMDFLCSFNDCSVDGVLFDPPYSPRQISEVYKSVGMAVHMKDTSSGFYSERKHQVAKIIKVGGTAICFGWNSTGIGMHNGFDLKEVLIVCHGGAHNDTIVTCEQKTKHIDSPPPHNQ